MAKLASIGEALRFVSLKAFLATEQANLKTGRAQYPRLLTRSEALNALYYTASVRIRVPIEEVVVASLFRLTHYQLHFTTGCFLRGHWGEAFASARKALNATMSGLVLHSERRLLQKFRESKYPFNNTTKYLQRRCAQFPMAGVLIDAHGMCDHYASHADFQSLSPWADTFQVYEGHPIDSRFNWFSLHDLDPVVREAIGNDCLRTFGLILRAWAPWVQAYAEGLPSTWQPEVVALLAAFVAEQMRIDAKFLKVR